MNDLVRFCLPDGRVVVVEADSLGAVGPAARGGKPREITLDLVRSLQAMQTAVELALQSLRDKAQPDSFRLTMGVKFNTEVGAVIAKTSGEGSLVIEMSWRRQQDLAEDRDGRSGE